MRRDYIDSMKADGYGEFLSACEALRNCKFVLAENRISAVLKAIADNKQLYSMFGVALYDFNYSVTFTECIGPSGFSLPSEPVKAIALVFRILVDIDSGKMSLSNFLEAYFFSVSVNESFARFNLEIIAPFEKYCRDFFARPELLPKPPAVSEQTEKAQSSLKSDALACVSSLIEIAESAIAATIDRAEFTTCLNGLVRALKSDDNDGTISAFLGVKYAVAYFFKSSKNVQDIYKKLEYDIKHLAD